jgi:uncharacterized membrane protein YvlD (DUF360 family)
MVRLLIRTFIALVTSAVAFVVADIVLDGFNVSYPEGLIIPVVIFTLATVLLAPVVEAMVDRYASWASILLGLIITLLSLIVTELLTDSLSIQGLSAWVIGTIIVWLASIVTTFAMGLLFRSSLQERRSN